MSWTIYFWLFMILWLAYFSKTSCGNHFKDDKLSSSPTTVKPEKKWKWIYLLAWKETGFKCKWLTFYLVVYNQYKSFFQRMMCARNHHFCILDLQRISFNVNHQFYATPPRSFQKYHSLFWIEMISLCVWETKKKIFGGRSFCNP